MFSNFIPPLFSPNTSIFAKYVYFRQLYGYSSDTIPKLIFYIPYTNTAVRHSNTLPLEHQTLFNLPFRKHTKNKMSVIAQNLLTGFSVRLLADLVINSQQDGGYKVLQDDDDNTPLEADELFKVLYTQLMGEEPTKEQFEKPQFIQEPTPRAPTAPIKPEPQPVFTSSSLLLSQKEVKKIEKKLDTIVPFLPNIIDYTGPDHKCCCAIKVNGNLFTPCGTHVKNEDDDDFPVCKTCSKQNNVDKHGHLTARTPDTLGIYMSPSDKKEISYATFLAKKSIPKGAKSIDRDYISNEVQAKIDALQQELNSQLPDFHLKIDWSKVKIIKNAPKKTKTAPDEPAAEEPTTQESDEESVQAPEPLDTQTDNADPIPDHPETVQEVKPEETIPDPTPLTRTTNDTPDTPQQDDYDDESDDDQDNQPNTTNIPVKNIKYTDGKIYQISKHDNTVYHNGKECGLFNPNNQQIYFK